jgi:hypothetical protein
MEFLETYNAIQRRFPHASKTTTDHTSTISIPVYGDSDTGDEEDVYCLCLSTLFAKYTLVVLTTTQSNAVTTIILAAMGNKTVLMDGATDIDRGIVRIDDNNEYGVVFDNNGNHMIMPLNSDTPATKAAFPRHRKYIKYSCSFLLSIVSWWLLTNLMDWITTKQT